MARPTKNHTKKSVEKSSVAKMKQELQPHEVITNQFNKVFEYFEDTIKNK